MKRTTKVRAAATALTVAAVTALAGCGGAVGGDSISIGSKNFAEQEILGELYAQALEAEDYSVDRQLDLGNVTVLDNALQSGEIDVYAEYTGTALGQALEYEGESPETAEETYETAKEGYEERDPAATLLERASFENNYAITVRQETAEEYGLQTVGDLAEASPELVFASFGEFQQNPDGFPNIQESYPEADFEDVPVVNDLGLRYQALQQGDADVAVGFTTDGQLASDELVVLEDEDNIWPFYHPAPVINLEYLEENPKVEEVIDSVTESVELEQMQEMVARVDVEQENVQDVAEEHLTEEGLI